jgi:hypothetical protein
MVMFQHVASIIDLVVVIVKVILHIATDEYQIEC